METCNGCVQCCLETEMPLSEEDIARIGKLGFEDFVVSSGGWLQLKNINGRCVFNDGKGCTIYDDRPEGCRFYPVIYDDSRKCAVLDEDCPRRGDFNVKDVDLKKLVSLVARLKKEKNTRKQ